MLAASLAAASVAGAQAPGSEPDPIPTDPGAPEIAELDGKRAKPHPANPPRVPRHPFMAPNGRSNIHNDAYMTDVYRGRTGPLGRGTETDSALFVRECASVAFDRRDRLETICVGLDHPVLAVLDPGTFEVLAAFDLPPRDPSTGDPFTDFSGGGYFYLDERDQAVIPTTTRHVFVVGQAEGPSGPSFELRRDYDLTPAVPSGDAIISILPDWDGRIWFASREGVVGWVDPRSGELRSLDTGERIGNSFAVDETGGVFVVTDAAMYRFEAVGGEPEATWREEYDNIGEQKPGQTQAGSGATPTLMGRRYVAITDNADPMQVVVYRRAKRVRGKRLVCEQPAFEQGASATDQSLLATRRSIVVENNHGYTGPAATMDGETTSPGLERIVVDRDGRGCRTAWRSDETAPSVVPKLAAGSGLVFTYTKPQRDDGTDAWYLTALDWRTGETVYRRLAGTGLGYNNNFAPVSIGPDETAYVGALGGLTLYSDQDE